MTYSNYCELQVLSLLIIALARPQSTSKSQKVNSEGISIVLALDISGSMKAEDFSTESFRSNQKMLP